jgi:hypothetical protein
VTSDDGVRNHFAQCRTPPDHETSERGILTLFLFLFLFLFVLGGFTLFLLGEDLLLGLFLALPL